MSKKMITYGVQAVLVLAVVLRLRQITAALWYDEAFSALLAQLSISQMIAATGGDVHPPTYYLLLAALGNLFGFSEIVMRLPSLMASLALIPLAGDLAERLHANKTVAGVVVFLVAFSPFQIHYATEARSYALLSLAVAVAALGLLDGRWRLAVAGSLAGLYLHNTAVLFLAPLWLISLRNDRRYWLAAAAVAVGYIPGLLWTITQAGQISGNFWVPPLTSPGRLVATLDDLFWFANQSPWVFTTALITGVVLVLIALDLPRLLRDPGGRFLLTAVFGPLLLLALASIAWQPVLISRVMAPAAVFYIILAAVVISRSPRRAMAVSLGLPVLLVLLATPTRSKINDDLLTDMQKFDAVYHANVGSWVVWNYYLPDMPHYLWSNPTDLDTTLSETTLTAMGAQQIKFDLIKCVSLADGRGHVTPLRRWAFIYNHNPTTAPTEIEFVASTVQQYHGIEAKILREDITTRAAIVEITPECDHETARY